MEGKWRDAGAVIRELEERAERAERQRRRRHAETRHLMKAPGSTADRARGRLRYACGTDRPNTPLSQAMQRALLARILCQAEPDQEPGEGNLEPDTGDHPGGDSSI
jgi:hypothetical protein